MKKSHKYLQNTPNLYSKKQIKNIMYKLLYINEQCKNVKIICTNYYVQIFSFFFNRKRNKSSYIYIQNLNQMLRLRIFLQYFYYLLTIYAEKVFL